MKDLDIHQLKLMNGDDIIALIVSKNENTFVVERPILVHPAGDGAYRFSPWFYLSSESIYTLDRLHIISHIVVDENVKLTYIQYALSDKEDISFDGMIDDDSDIDDQVIEDIVIH